MARLFECSVPYRGIALLELFFSAVFGSAGKATSGRFLLGVAGASRSIVLTAF